MEAKILFNVAYSYDVIRETAREVQSKQSWQQNDQVRKLLFSPHWVRSLLNRADLRRRKITREDKLIPDIQQIRSIMLKGQQKIIENGHDERTE